MKTRNVKNKKTRSTEKMLAVIYARYSSKAQRDVSIEQQVEQCMKHAKALGVQVINTYEDRAISGRTDNRPAFQKMMKDADSGMFQMVLAWKSNRMGRNMLQAMVNEARLQDLGILVRYAEEDFDDSAAGRFALRSMMNVNQFYSENMAEDVARGLEDNASKCLCNGSLPIGYKSTSGGKIVVDTVRADLVKEIFSRIATGETYASVARDLNARGIKTSTGKKWTKMSFGLLRNERYRGIYIYKDYRVEGGIPRIIDDDLFFAVQEIIKRKKSNRQMMGWGGYLLTGKLRCGHCGGYMVGISGTSRMGNLHYYYVCQTKRMEHTCKKSNLRKEPLEKAVVQAVVDYIGTPEVIEWLADKTMEYLGANKREAELMMLEQQLAHNKLTIGNLMKAIELGIFTETTKDRMLELEREQAELIGKIALAKSRQLVITREDIIASLNLFCSGDIDDQRFREKIIDTFVLEVKVFDDYIKVIFNFSGNESTEIPLSAEKITADSEMVIDEESVFVFGKIRATKFYLYEPPSIVAIEGVFVLFAPLDL